MRRLTTALGLTFAQAEVLSYFVRKTAASACWLVREANCRGAGNRELGLLVHIHSGFRVPWCSACFSL